MDLRSHARYGCHKFLLIIVFLVICGSCANDDHKSGSVPEGESASISASRSATETDSATGSVPLSWESTRPSETKKWSQHVQQKITASFSTFNSAKDMVMFCTHWNKLSEAQKINTWGMLISEVAYF